MLDGVSAEVAVARALKATLDEFPTRTARAAPHARGGISAGGSALLRRRR